MNDASSLPASEHSYFADEKNRPEAEITKHQIDFSKTSSNPEGIFDTLNKEIKHVIENCKDLSYYSNSNSKISEQQQYNEQFLDSRYWCVRKNHYENDSYKAEKKSILKNNKKYENEIEEKIIYINDEDEKNNFKDDDFFNDEDMEEKTIEKSENDINEINSIKVNHNNLNNKNQDYLNNNNNSNNLNENNGKNSLNKTKYTNEPDDKFVVLNEKISSNTPNKVNQSYFPYIYNGQQVHSFISTYNNYPSTFSKGSFISTNNSSNNKYKKDEDHCSSEEENKKNNNLNINNINIDEIKKSNNNCFNHGNKFGPHLNNYNQLPNNSINTINIETANITNINNISNFNMNNNFLYNSVPKMNLNMVYYIPVQQQSIATNNNYINNNKIFSNLNNIISDNNSALTHIKNKEKANQTQNNNTNTNGNTNNINGNKSNDNNANANNISSSNEEKSKTKENSNNNNTNNNNYKNNSNNNSNNNNYKNGSYKKVEKTTNSNSSNNQNQNNSCNKGEKNLLNLDDIISGKDTRTTVMIRNIPIKYTDEILVEELEEFKGKYDCLYMPFDYEKKGNKGYAFINFVNPLHILYFHEKFYGKKWKLFESSKICELNNANFQGIYEIQKHSKNYKGYKKPLFYSEQNNNKNSNENIVIPSKFLLKLKERYPNMKYHENKMKKIIIVDSFE